MEAALRRTSVGGGWVVRKCEVMVLKRLVGERVGGDGVERSGW